MLKNISTIAGLFSVLILSSCATTRITSSWREPDKQVNMQDLNKVLVVALFRKEKASREAEDQMAASLHGKGVVSYQYLGSGFDKKNEEVIRDRIKADGFDAAVTMRLVDVDKEVTYIPGRMTTYPSYFRSFSGYYYRSWNYYNTPDRYATTRTFTVEINVFSIKEDRIIWSGLTETTDPDGIDKLTQHVVRVVEKRMRKEGFITK